MSSFLSPSSRLNALFSSPHHGDAAESSSDAVSATANARVAIGDAEEAAPEPIEDCDFGGSFDWPLVSPSNFSEGVTPPAFGWWWFRWCLGFRPESRSGSLRETSKARESAPYSLVAAVVVVVAAVVVVVVVVVVVATVVVVADLSVVVSAGQNRKRRFSVELKHTF